MNPNGGEVSECEFEYGTTNAYGRPRRAHPPPGSGTSPVAVSASVTGLTANTTYHFRISATNAGGTSKGSDETFRTLVHQEKASAQPSPTSKAAKSPSAEPNAVALDPSGNIWAADSAHDHVLQFNSGRAFLRQIGSEGSGRGSSKASAGLATDSSGDLYVSDTGNGPRAGVLLLRDVHQDLRLLRAPGKGSAPLAPWRSSQSGNVWVLNGWSAQAGGRVGGVLSERRPISSQLGSFGERRSGAAGAAPSA